MPVISPLVAQASNSGQSMGGIHWHTLLLCGGCTVFDFVSSLSHSHERLSRPHDVGCKLRYMPPGNHFDSAALQTPHLAENSCHPGCSHESAPTCETLRAWGSHQRKFLPSFRGQLLSNLNTRLTGEPPTSEPGTFGYSSHCFRPWVGAQGGAGA